MTGTRSSALDIEENFAPRAVDISYRADGCLVLRSPIPLGDYRNHLCEYLVTWSEQAPDRTFIAERDQNDEWRRLTYRDAWGQARAIGQALVNRRLGQAQPIAILTGNSIEHALITFAGMLSGVPVSPISPAYSTHPEGLQRVAGIAGALKPAMVFVQSIHGFDAVRRLPGLADAEWVSVKPDPTTTSFESLVATEPGDGIDDAFARATGDDVAKILFTSGSTGTPKGVPQTQRMLCSSVHASSLLTYDAEPPVLVDWMPWHHTMGGNNTLHGTLRDGGTLYIDDGRPTPQLFGRTVRNLKEISITSGQNVPAGIQMLVECMEKDEELRANFFRRLRRFMYAGASLPGDVWKRFQALAMSTLEREIPVISGYGTTETAPGIAVTHWASEGQGEVGLPIPGVEVKLVPAGDRYEVRVRGLNVMPGYLGRPDLNETAFDAEGFYKVGDAVKFVDPLDPRRGLRFAGRISENFKLSNGAWVLVGDVRAAVMAAAPSIGEAVIAGADRADIRILVWAAPSARSGLSDGRGHQRGLEVQLEQQIAAELRAYNKTNAATTRRIAAFALLSEPPSLGAGEITDKGYVNQRAVLTNQTRLVEDLYAAVPSERVILLS